MCDSFSLCVVSSRCLWWLMVWYSIKASRWPQLPIVNYTAPAVGKPPCKHTPNHLSRILAQGYHALLSPICWKMRYRMLEFWFSPQKEGGERSWLCTIQYVHSQLSTTRCILNFIELIWTGCYAWRKRGGWGGGKSTHLLYEQTGQTDIPIYILVGGSSNVDLARLANPVRTLRGR